MAHMKPLPADTTPELADDFAIFERILGFVPNSLLTMQRVPGHGGRLWYADQGGHGPRRPG